MGEKKEEATSEKKAAPAGENKDDGPITAVYKIDMHCEGCASKIRRVVKNYDGVVDVKADCPANKLTVTGKMDPTKVKEKLEQRIKKRVELISSLPKKDDGAAGGDKKADEKPDEKAEEKKPKEASTVILKIRLHCDGCTQKIRKIITKINGVESVDVESGQDLVTVKGTMDLKQLVPYLKEKLRRSVELISPNKDDGAAAKNESDKNVSDSGKKKDKETGAAEKKAKEPDSGGQKKQEEADSGEKKKEKEAADGGDKKEKEKEAGAVEKKEKEVGAGGEKEGPDDKKQGNEKAASNGDEGGKTQESGSEGVVVANRMEFYGYPQDPHPSYFHGGNPYSSSYIYSYANEAQPSNPTHEYVNPGYVNQRYVNQGYVVPSQLHAPQMFSDENPNACSIM